MFNNTTAATVVKESTISQCEYHFASFFSLFICTFALVSSNLKTCRASLRKPKDFELPKRSTPLTRSAAKKARLGLSLIRQVSYPRVRGHRLYSEYIFKLKAFIYSKQISWTDNAVNSRFSFELLQMILPLAP